MRLTVDADVLVGEGLRRRGQRLLTDSALNLFVAAEAWDETQHELRRRLAEIEQRGYLTASEIQDLQANFAAIVAALAVVDPGVYAARLDEARNRLPRDPNDAPTLALALSLESGIWTNDRD